MTKIFRIKIGCLIWCLKLFNSNAYLESSKNVIFKEYLYQVKVIEF